MGMAAGLIVGALTAAQPIDAGHSPGRSHFVAAMQSEAAAPFERALPRGPRRSTCDRLKSLVGKLGETFAGYRLRQSWSVRVCAMTHHAFDDGIWSWPWGATVPALSVESSDGLAHTLPPRLHRTIGAWDIRCGRVGTRQRCALIRADVLRGADGADGGRVVSHFVIDAVAGREIVLWRVFVEQALTGGDALSLLLPGRVVREPFDQCMSSGCLMEAEVAVSADVATQLWQGQGIEFRVAMPSGAAVVILPPLGFREGLGELTRLRREDRGLTATGIVP